MIKRYDANILKEYFLEEKSKCVSCSDKMDCLLCDPTDNKCSQCEIAK